MASIINGRRSSLEEIRSVLYTSEMYKFMHANNARLSHNVEVERLRVHGHFDLVECCSVPVIFNGVENTFAFFHQYMSLYNEKELRKSHPTLAQAYNEYLVLLQLIMGEVKV